MGCAGDEDFPRQGVHRDLSRKGTLRSGIVGQWRPPLPHARAGVAASDNPGFRPTRRVVEGGVAHDVEIPVVVESEIGRAIDVRTFGKGLDGGPGNQPPGLNS